MSVIESPHEDLVGIGITKQTLINPSLSANESNLFPFHLFHCQEREVCCSFLLVHVHTADDANAMDASIYATTLAGPDGYLNYGMILQ